MHAWPPVELTLVIRWQSVPLDSDVRARLERRDGQNEPVEEKTKGCSDLNSSGSQKVRP